MYRLSTYIILFLIFLLFLLLTASSYSIHRSKQPIYHSSFYPSFYSSSYSLDKSSTILLFGIPVSKDILLDISSLEVIRILGRIDITTDQSIENERKMSRDDNIDELLSESNRQSLSSPSPLESGRLTSVRIYDGFIAGKRCFLKEFLPAGSMFGKNELQVVRRISGKWNKIIADNDDALRKRSSVFTELYPPFPRLVGHVTSDNSFESLDFRQKWRRRFPSVRPPESNNLWLAYEWDNSTFRTMRAFPPLPQIIEGLDYFRKDQRILKRWLFIRKVLRKALEAVDYLHTCGYCHNSINIQSLWMSTTIQQKIQNLTIQLTDYGASRKLSDDTVYSRQEMIEDYYQLAFVFLEFIISSFNDDNMGARQVRELLDQNGERPMQFLPRAEDMDFSQLTQREYQQTFEKLCESDYTKLRMFVRSISKWREASEILEQDEGAGWKLIFKMLARGSLYEADRVTPIRITGRRLIRESYELFEETLKV